ncbi:MAG: hypothetical protein IJX26_00560 [Clostridia bacterium]|nr:hypothetical protein [Clostridia bacterium]
MNRNNGIINECILELWHIETFEGGSVSRETFLERCALQFEKKNKGTYVVIIKMSVEQFYLNIKNNKKPNMLSFGVGVGDDFANSLITLNWQGNIRTDLLAGGKHNGSQLAVPYILGGYALIGNEISNNKVNGKTGVGLTDGINPLLALKSNNISSDFFNNVALDTYSAYDKYVKGGFENLLGTQRDVFRISNKKQQGLLSNVRINFLGGFTDLIQYVSVFNHSKAENDLSQEFVDLLTSQTTQNKLKDIGMFSVLKNTKLYDDETYSQMENTLNGTLKTTNVFTELSILQAEKNKLIKEYKIID